MNAKTFTAEVKADGSLTRFVISDEGIDRDGDEIVLDGWDLEAYRRNPVVLFAHSHKDPPVGKATEIHVDRVRRALLATVEWAPTEAGREMAALYAGGFLNAVSVGFRPLESTPTRTGTRYLRQELIEFSACPVPANPRALMLASAAGLSTKAIRCWAERVLDDDPVVLELVDEADLIELPDGIGPVELAELVGEAVAIELANTIVETTEREINRRRGRVD